MRRVLRIAGKVCAVLAPLGGLLLLLFVGVPWLRVLFDDRTPSRSIGRPGAGRIEHAHALPPWGEGFRSYSLLGSMLGRQYGNGAALDTLRAALAERARADAGRVHIIGEIGVKRGGRFHGHRTHQNGLSVDLFMPLRDGTGARATLPTWPWHGLGYWHEFDARGQAAGRTIDFEELAALLQAIERSAGRNGLAIERVIITPEYVPLLLATETGRRLGALADRLTRRPVWVRHDEHVHIDFAVVR
jgi:penicillin-insensitive murein endopeptidase